MRKSFVVALGFCVASALAAVRVAAQQPIPAPNFIREDAPVIGLTHVEVIDGTGSAAQSDQTVIIEHGKISAVGATASVQVPSGARIIDATGKTVIPGLVGMHEHLFYPAAGDGSLTGVEQFFSFPPLYLASGVTTGRTTGSMDPYGDIAVKARVDSGKMLGPNLFLSTPYLQGAPSLIAQMYELKNAEDARAFVRYWHSVGFTSVKAYVDVTPDELRAGIDEAHKLNMKVTGHLCSVGYNEAAEMGIDNLEHGPFGAPDGELYSKRQPGICGPDYFAEVRDIVMNVEPDGPQLKQTIQNLVAHHVAITSTLAVLEGGLRPPMDRDGLVTRTRMLLVPEAWSKVMTNRANREATATFSQMMLQKEMKFEREFVAAGGLLMAGCDPTGYGGVVPGFGDQRNIELLVEAGFSAVEAIRIATLNGATFMGKEAGIGSIAVGKSADLVVLAGNPVEKIEDIENVELVFKDGIGYNPSELIESATGIVGVR